MTSKSIYYGKPQSANAFPHYTTADLLRDLASPSLDAETRARIEAEVARREAPRGGPRLYLLQYKSEVA